MKSNFIGRRCFYEILSIPHNCYNVPTETRTRIFGLFIIFWPSRNVILSTPFSYCIISNIKISSHLNKRSLPQSFDKIILVYRRLFSESLSIAFLRTIFSVPRCWFKFLMTNNTYSMIIVFSRRTTITPSVSIRLWMTIGTNPA